MIGKLLRSKGFWALVVPMVLTGAAYAGEAAGCPVHQQMAKADAPMHCHLMAKGVTKTAEMIDGGVKVTLKGSTEDAIEHIKDHLDMHASGKGCCASCPLAMKGVTTKVDLTDDGGTITATADNDEALEALKTWANAPPGACCAGAKAESKT